MILFSVIALFPGGAACVQSAEASRGTGENDLLSERYANKVQDLILKSLELVGINYRWGSAHPDAGLDCSGFVQFVFNDATGKMLPRTAKEQSKAGYVVDKNELQPGDLVFFNTMRRAFSHVGIYLGEDHFVHAPRTGKKIRVDDMSRSYWTKRYNGARRIVEY
jgi:cell wall-associated NlpC family hydrolase